MMKSGQMGAAAAIVGPAIFVGISLSGGWVEPGYSAYSDYVSALSLGEHGWVQIASFVIVGTSLLLFAFTVAREFADRAVSIAGPIVVAILGIGYLLSGPLVMDPPGTALGALSGHGLAHGILGAMVFILMPVACFIFLRHFGRIPAWHGLWWPTLILGCLVAVADIAFTLVTKSPNFIAISTAEGGLLQRLVIIPFMGWIALFGARLLIGT
jgi:hypothetical protein